MSEKIFNNPVPKIKPKGLLDIIKWKLHSKQPKWPNEVPLITSDIPPARVEGDEIRVSFVGHVSFLIQTQALNILTDPVWSMRASPFSFAGPKRVTPPGIKFEDLPKIDVVLISHNHYDHMDINTIKKLWIKDRPHVIAPLINDAVLKSSISGIEVTTLDWSEKISIINDVEIALEPAQHWSARGLFDQNKALWGTFLISTPKGTICFIGDTGYSKELFEGIGKKYENILLSLIPIGAFEPRWFMSDVHINPEEAILIHQHLNSKFSIGSHFETFQLADDKFDQSRTELDTARAKFNISLNEFITPNIGGVYRF